MKRLAVLNDRHQVTAAEAAYTSGFGATYRPNRNPEFVAYAAIPEAMEAEVYWRVFSAELKIVDSAGKYRRGLMGQIMAPIPGDTGAFLMASGIFSGNDIIAFQNGAGLITTHGLRWWVWNGLAENDLVIFRATYEVVGVAA